MQAHAHRSVLELLQQEEYTPRELAALLGMSVDRICHAAFAGELRARIVGHDVVSIRRRDVVDWLEGPGGRTPTPSTPNPGAKPTS